MKTSKTGCKMRYPELRGKLSAIKYPAIAEIKRDGELGELIITANGGMGIYNKYGTLKLLEETDNIYQHIKPALKYKPCTLIGELTYQFGLAGDLYKMSDPGTFAFWVFDIVTYEGTDVSDLPLIDRKELIANMGLFNKSCIHIVENKEEVDEFFKQETTIGYEGIVVKNMDSRYVTGPCGWVKIKKKDQTEYEVAYIDPTHERIEIAVPDPKATGIATFVRVGCKVSNTNKALLKLGDKVLIEHQGILDSGKLRHPVYLGTMKEGRLYYV